MSKEQPSVENLRNKPSFNNYASDWIASEEYALASLNERGLVWSAMNYCWVNQSIPSDPMRMARLLGFSDDDIKQATGALFRRVFNPDPTNQARLVCKELEQQKRIIEERRLNMSKGGRKGGLATQRKSRKENHPSSHPKASELKGNEINRNAVSKKELSPEQQGWIDDYEGKASNERQCEGNISRL